MIRSCMLFKGLVKIAIITSTINAHVYIEVLNNFLIPSIENWFSGDEVIFRMIMYQRGLKLFFRKGI